MDEIIPALNISLDLEKPILLKDVKDILELFLNQTIQNTSEKHFINYVYSFVGICMPLLAFISLFVLFKKMSDLFPGWQAMEVKSEHVKVNFDDVLGLDEAKKEVKIFVEFLKNPKKFEKLGGRLPKGALLVGPPGNGKTLLARAIAGEALVPFFFASGAEFDDSFVGSGAKRIRKLFNAAKKKSPAIVFIDEIDSIGYKRISNDLHPYANQTINQLLTEMDGFSDKHSIIVFGATNRPDCLDKALLRPGRFDTQIHIGKPELHDRTEILKYYLLSLSQCDIIDSVVISRGIIGFSGADIKNLVNQAALLAATQGSEAVTMKHLEEAKDRILMGSTRIRPHVLDQKTKEISAYHEAGHTLIAYFNKDAMPIYKVTIVPKGESLGHTALLPAKDEFQATKAQLLAQLQVMMGGRAAEELIFGPTQITTGAADDFTKATKIAKQMVRKFGMTKNLPLRDFTDDENEYSKKIGESTYSLLDVEINLLLNEAYESAKNVLQQHEKEHRNLARQLLDKETLNFQEIDDVIKSVR